MTSIKDKAAGHWAHILGELGIPASCLTGPNKRCPLCPDSRDSFSFNHARGTFYCRKCQGGSGTDLVMKALELDFKAAAKEIERVLGVAEKVQPFKPQRDPAEALNRVWKQSRPVRVGDEVHLYLMARGLSALPPTLRYHHGLRVEGNTYSAMLATFLDANGKPESLHRTFILNGRKAPIERPKRVMTPKTTISGCAIRLWPATDVVALTEGIESAIAAYEYFGVPAWACFSADNLAAVKIPRQISCVIVCGDNDAHRKFKGNKAATDLAYRLANEGRNVELFIPPLPGTDMLDYLIQYRKQRVA